MVSLSVSSRLYSDANDPRITKFRKALYANGFEVYDFSPRNSFPGRVEGAIKWREDLTCPLVEYKIMDLAKAYSDKEIHAALADLDNVLGWVSVVFDVKADNLRVGCLPAAPNAGCSITTGGRDDKLAAITYRSQVPGYLWSHLSLFCGAVYLYARLVEIYRHPEDPARIRKILSDGLKVV